MVHTGRGRAGRKAPCGSERCWFWLNEERGLWIMIVESKSER